MNIYVDDTTVTTSVKTLKELDKTIVPMLNKFESPYGANHLKLNKDKTMLQIKSTAMNLNTERNKGVEPKLVETSKPAVRLLGTNISKNLNRKDQLFGKP